MRDVKVQVWVEWIVICTQEKLSRSYVAQPVAREWITSPMSELETAGRTYRSIYSMNTICATAMRPITIPLGREREKGGSGVPEGYATLLVSLTKM